MANPAKRKGSQFETDFVRYLHGLGYVSAERRAQRGRLDAGDISSGPRGVCFELKATQALALGAATKQAEAEAVNAGAKYSIAVHKRRFHSIGESYAIMTLDQLMEMLKELGL